MKKLKTVTHFHYNVPLMILVCYDMREVWTIPGDRYYQNYNSGEQDASIAATTMMYEAEELGIHTIWIRGFDPRSYNNRKIPVLFIMTSNAAREYYAPLGYRRTLKGYRKSLDAFVGNTKLFVAGNTLQVKDYSRFKWTMFNPDAKKEHHDKVFPEERKNVFALGAEMVKKPW